MSIYYGKSSLGILLRSYIHLKMCFLYSFAQCVPLLLEFSLFFMTHFFVCFYPIKFSTHENITFKLAAATTTTKIASKRKLKTITIKNNTSKKI